MLRSNRSISPATVVRFEVATKRIRVVGWFVRELIEDYVRVRYGVVDKRQLFACDNLLTNGLDTNLGLLPKFVSG